MLVKVSTDGQFVDPEIAVDPEIRGALKVHGAQI